MPVIDSTLLQEIFRRFRLIIISSTAETETKEKVLQDLNALLQHETFKSAFISGGQAEILREEISYYNQRCNASEGVKHLCANLLRNASH